VFGYCPFRDSACTKSNKKNPLGICSFAAGSNATIVCPVRFQEKARLFKDVGRIAFGAGCKVAASPEIRVLKVPGARSKRIGKIDFMLSKIGGNGLPVDFCALEVQSVYISGKSIRPAFKTFLATGKLRDAERRPDFRSSAQKRLMPQLSLKVPIFRRWGKKFFVAVDDSFFRELPPMRSVSSAENAEVTWMVYPFQPQTNGDYQMGEPHILHTLWDDVVTALREGEPPEPKEILEEISESLEDAVIVST
jgi:hypothetical protein